MVQWLRLHAPNARCRHSFPGEGTRSHMLQLRVSTLQVDRAYMPQQRLKILHAGTKPQSRQINKYFKKERKNYAHGYFIGLENCCCCCQVASVVSKSVRPHRRQHTRLPRPWVQPWVIFQLFLNLSITLSRFKVHSNALAVEVGERVYLTHLAETKLPLTDSQNLEYQLLSYFFSASNPISCIPLGDAETEFL